MQRRGEDSRRGGKPLRGIHGLLFREESGVLVGVTIGEAVKVGNSAVIICLNDSSVP